MRAVALSCYFLSTFGAAWMLCMRATDWNTPRWHEASRYMTFLIGVVVWIWFFNWLGQAVYPIESRTSDAVSIMVVSGLLSGIAAYVATAWLSPGTAGAKRSTPEPKPDYDAPPPKSTSEWLLLDIRRLPQLLRRNPPKSNNRRK
jgi:hypothetical protein